MSDEQFKELSKEVIPLIEQMIEISKKYVPDNKICSVAFTGDGYFTFGTHASNANISRVGNGRKIYLNHAEVFDAGTD